MATNATSQVIQHLRRILLTDECALTDGQLLGCFIESRDEAAFAVLVKRHGGLVWNVCRRLLGPQDAEDAFQATFLVLCRRAASIRQREMLASYLYKVAHQTALRAQRAVIRRRAREKQVANMPEPAAAEKDLWNDVLPLLDQELSRLPESCQVVILLCDLEGKTRKEAAQQLGLAEGTVGSRLARARAMLAKRLKRHGLLVSGGVLAGLLSQQGLSASVPPSVVSSTLQVASVWAAGHAMAAGAISVKVAALTEGVLKAMLLTKLKLASVLLLTLGMIALASGMLATARTNVTGNRGEKAAASTPAPAKTAPAERENPLAVTITTEKKADANGDRDQSKTDLDWHKFYDPKAFFLTDPFAVSISKLPAQEKKDALARLQEALRHREAEVRRRAALTLGSLGDRSGVPTLIADLEKTTGHEQNNALVALRIMKDKRAIPGLRKALKAPSPYVRGMAAATLGELKATQAFADLVALTRDKGDTDVKPGTLDCLRISPAEMACYALGALGDRRAIPVLIECMKDNDLRNQARQALEVLTRQKLGNDPEKWKAWWRQNP